MKFQATAPVPDGQASSHMAQSIRHAFCTVMNGGGLSPLAALELAAAALGAIYREAAAAHCGPGACPCGWHPEESADLKALQAALAAVPDLPPDLCRMVPLGRG